MFPLHVVRQVIRLGSHAAQLRDAGRLNFLPSQEPITDCFASVKCGRHALPNATQQNRSDGRVAAASHVRLHIRTALENALRGVSITATAAMHKTGKPCGDLAELCTMEKI